MGVKAIPDGYHSVTPYLVVDRAAEAIRWYEQAVGANAERTTIAVPGRGSQSCRARG